MKGGSSRKTAPTLYSRLCGELRLGFALATGAVSFPVSLIRAFESYQIMRGDIFTQRTAGPVESIGIAIPEVIGFLPFGSFAPDPYLFGHGLSLAVEQEREKFRVSFVGQHKGEAFLHHKSIDHLAVIEEDIGEQTTITVFSLFVKFQADMAVSYSAEVITL